MSSSEFSGWMQYYQIEPFGQWRDNYHAAIIASITANIHSQTEWNVTDFIYSSQTESKNTEESMTLSTLNILDAMAR